MLPPKRRPARQSGRQQSETSPVIRQQRGPSDDSYNKHDTVGSYCSNNSYTDRSRKTENQQNFVLYVHKSRVGIVPIRSTWVEIGVR